MNIKVFDDENSAVVGELIAGVRSHNLESMGPERTKPLSVIARDDNGMLIGGISGRTIYKNFLIEVLWVASENRGAGLGRKLMALAECEAKKRECVIAQVDTLSFQAPDFYKKIGFEVIGSVPELPDSPARYFLLKKYSFE